MNKKTCDHLVIWVLPMPMPALQITIPNCKSHRLKITPYAFWTELQQENYDSNHHIHQFNSIKEQHRRGEDQKTKSTSPCFLMRTPCRIQEIFKEEFIVQKTRIRPRHHLHTLHQDHEQQQGVDQQHDVLHTRPQPADQYLYHS